MKTAMPYLDWGKVDTLTLEAQAIAKRVCHPSGQLKGARPITPRKVDTGQCARNGIRILDYPTDAGKQAGVDAFLWCLVAYVVSPNPKHFSSYALDFCYLPAWVTMEHGFSPHTNPHLRHLYELADAIIDCFERSTWNTTHRFAR